MLYTKMKIPHYSTSKLVCYKKMTKLWEQQTVKNQPKLAGFSVVQDILDLNTMWFKFL